MGLGVARSWTKLGNSTYVTASDESHGEQLPEGIQTNLRIARKLYEYCFIDHT